MGIRYFQLIIWRLTTGTGGFFLGFLLLPGLLLLALLLQVTVTDMIQIRGVVPDLVFLLVVFYAFVRGRREGAFWGYVAGLLQDLVTGHYFGLNALSMMAVGYLVGWCEGRVYKESSLVVTVVAGLSFLAGQMVHYLLLAFLGVTVPPGIAFLRVIFPAALYNVLLAPIFYRRFYRMYVKGWFRFGQY